MTRSTIRLATISMTFGILWATLSGGSLLTAKASEVAQAPTRHKSPAHVAKITKKLPAYHEVKIPYKSSRFDLFVNESYHYNNAQNTQSFYDWLDNSYINSKNHYPGHETLKLEDLLNYRKHELACILNSDERAKAEIETAAWLHKMIKGIIPKFSLDRGYEFYYVAQRGERQCYLQSVLITGLLQRMGINAGVVMVYKNITGEESNNGHAMVLLRLPNGRDITVDASEPVPFVEHKGLFVRMADYVYVNPAYDPQTHEIVHYNLASNGYKASPYKIHALDLGFIRSQFWYYRGERAQGGIVLTPKSPEGMEKAAKALRISVAFCPKNPLPVYMLGRVYYSQGKTEQSKAIFERADKLYSKFGWTPGGLKQYIDLTNPIPAKTGCSGSN